MFEEYNNKNNNKEIHIAILNKFEIENNALSFFFESVLSKDFNKLDNFNIEEPDILYEIKTNSILYKTFIEKINFDYENVIWYQLLIKRNCSNTNAQIYPDIESNEEIETIYIEDMQPININNSALKKVFDMDENKFKDASQATLQNILDSIAPYCVITYNVGQGNCNGLCDTNGIPHAYFDFGGSDNFNKKSYPGNIYNPNPITFCYSYNPTVFLSHWDTDHMQSALISVHSAIKDCNWVVPRQYINYSQLKLLIELYNKGKLLIWPKNLNSISSTYLYLEKLNSKVSTDKNNNGLALSVQTRNNKTILLPADANYNNLSLPFYFYDGLVATHHGSKTHGCLKKIPLANKNSIIAFSYGIKNIHLHPKAISKSLHSRRGWKNQKTTTNGHIVLDNSIKFKTMPCHGHCTLGNTI